MYSKKYGALIKKIKFGASLIHKRIINKRAPLMANLLITNMCNLKCFYCYANVFERNLKELTTSEILSVIDTLWKKGTRLIVLLGGEPLLRKDIEIIIEDIKKKGLICELITNGYLVKKKIEALKGLDSVCVSLDGDERGNDLNRGRGSYRKAIEAIEVLKGHNVPVRVKAVITRNNIDSIDFLADFSKRNNIILTASFAATYEDRNYSQSNVWISDEDIRSFFAKLKYHKENNVSIGYSFKALNYCIKWPYSYTKIIDNQEYKTIRGLKFIRCLRKDYSLYMDSDGSIYPCAYLWGKNGINMLSDGFDKAWENLITYNCYCCGSMPDVELSLLFGLNYENMMRARRF